MSAPELRVQVSPEFRTSPRSLITQPIDRVRLAPTLGAVHPRVATAQDLGGRDPGAPMEHMQIFLHRPAERQAAFDAEIEALHQRGNPSYHRWLSPETIGTEFGPSSSDLATLTAYLQSEGFTVNRFGKSGMYVDFSGTVAQVQQSFHTQIHNLRLATGELRYSAVGEAQLPEALAPLVAGFLPLGNITPRPTLVRSPPGLHPPAGGGAEAGALPGDAQGGGFVGVQDFYTIYNELPLINAGTVTGSGVTVAVLEQSDISSSDVSAFRSLYGVTPATPSLTIQVGSPSVQCTDPGFTSDQDEAVLDAEWAGATAPGATVLFMVCSAVAYSAEAVVDDNLASVMSLSYGETEVGQAGTGTFFSDLWEQAVAQGQTVVVSAGDDGSANTQDQNQSIANYGLAVNAIASTRFNVAAGGTDFQDNFNQQEGDASFNIAHYWSGSNGTGHSSALSYVAETTWNNTCASSILSYLNKSGSTDPNALCNGGGYEPTGGGGGGVSILHGRPSWQTGTVYGIPSTGVYNHRLLPDISLFASNGPLWNHALDYYLGGAAYAGGTSFVAPQLAGVFALIAQKTGGRLGQPNYVLYNMAGVEYGTSSFAGSSCNGSGATSNYGTTASSPASTCIFYDIQTGNNSQACANGSTNCYTESSGSAGILSTSTTAAQVAYPAGQGYDLATGLGSLNIANLVNNWQNASAGGESFTPSISLSASSTSYTYGSPPAITYTATVSGSGSFPSGSVTFSGTGAVSTIGVAAITESSGCAIGSTCTQSAVEVYTPPSSVSAGSYTITGSYLNTGENYTSGAHATASLTVSKASLTVGAVPQIVSYNFANATLTATIAYTGSGNPPTGGLTFKVDSGSTLTATCTGSSSPLTCTYSGYNTSGLALGSHTLTVNALTDTNYTAASGSTTLSVDTAPSISFTVPNHHTLDASFTVSATSNSSGAFTFSLVSGPAAVSGNTVTLTGAAGTVTLQASEAASGSYGPLTLNASFSVIAGSVWFGNGTSSLSAFALTGAALTGTGGFTGGGVGTIAKPLGTAFDSSGNMWVASSNGVSLFNRQGAAFSSTPFTGGGVGNPKGLAVDGLGRVWTANSNGTVSVLSSSGAAVSPSTGYPGPGTTPAGIAIDISGSVWVPSSTANTVTRILGAAAPVETITAGAQTLPGVEP